MNYQDPKLKDIAKKHKKILEKISIQPGGYVVNGNQFFLVVYRKKRIKGYTVISPQYPKNVSHYMEALDWLVKYSLYVTSLSEDGYFRASINMSSFEVVYAFLKQVTEQVNFKEKPLFIECLNSVEYILNLQDELIDQYNEFNAEQNKLDQSLEEHFTKEYVNDLLQFVGELEYIQYTQLNTQYLTVDKFKEVYKIAKSNPDIKQYLNYDVRFYLSKFSKGKKGFRKSLQNLSHKNKNMDQLTKEEHIAAVKQTALESAEVVKAKILKILRFPNSNLSD